MSIRAYRAYFHYLSGNAKYFFIHIPKNAGVAIRHSPLLRGRVVGAEPGFHISRAYTRNLARIMKANGEHHGYHHARYRDIHPSVVKKLQPVAIIRNPWSRVVSRFTFAQAALKSGASPPGYVSDTFEEFLEERHIFGNRDLYWHRAIRGWYPQLDYVIDNSGQIAVDILRQEHLKEETMAYFSLKEPVSPRNSSGSKRDYRDFYDAKSIQIVADWYAKDIETFGFDFDTSAQKNAHYTKTAV